MEMLGTFEKGGGALAKIRRAEADAAAIRLGIKAYTVLDNHDGDALSNFGCKTSNN